MKEGALDQLHDIHLPEVISWWPPAPGWWLLLLLCCLMIAGCYYGWRWYQNKKLNPSKKALWKAGMQEFSQVESAICSGDTLAIAGLSSLMRRVARQLDMDTSRPVAGLTGEAWLEWLDSRWQRHDFCSGAGQALITAPYQVTADSDAIALCQVCREWLEAQF
ncbi:MAG: DUF4381 domain-containing protein [Mariprofundus sp.]|nr:DUF4381 domain-containing protein [Mariprofundus sp.]